MSEKYLGEHSTPILINQIKEKCTLKVSTLPTASADELGKIYQYIGTTSGSIVHNYFYECVSDGEVTPTYSWQQVNVQPSAETPTAATTTFDNTTSELQATNVQDAIDEVEGRVDTAESDINDIEEKIPSTASDTNKLVDHDSLGTAAFKDFTPNVAPNNHNLVESNAVYNAITTALTSIYTPRGDLSCAELTSSLLVAANVGNIYEMSDSGTTSALFLQGAGKTINVGDNVGIIQTGVSEYKFNLMANAFDMTDYQKKDLSQAVESATTVEGALDALSTNKADKVSSATNGDFAGLDSHGNLIDSGRKASDFATASGLMNEIITRAELGAHNLLDVNDYKSLDNLSLSNGIFTNTETDSKASLSFFIDAVDSNGTIVAHVISSRTISSTGTQAFSITIPANTEYLRIGHNGTQRNLTARIYFSQTGNFKFSINIVGYDVQTIGGLSFKELQITDTKDVYVGYLPYAPTNSQLLSYKNNGILGAKNFALPIKSYPVTSNGIVLSTDSDGITTVTGTATASGGRLSMMSDHFVLKKGVYKIVGFPSDTTKYLDLVIHTASNNILGLWTNTGATPTYSDTFALTVDTECFVGLNTEVNTAYGTGDFKFGFNVQLASDADLTYQPYAMTNKELTDANKVEKQALDDLKENLTGTVKNTESYVMRKGLGSLVNFDMVGGTLAWNQLVQNGDFESTDGWSTNQALLSVADNVATITFSSSQGKIVQNMSSFADHVYLTTADLKASDSSSSPTLWSFLNNDSSGVRKTVDSNITQWNNIYIMEKISEAHTTPQLQVRNISSPLPSDTTVNVRNMMCIDLTQMFGSTIADYIYSLEQANAGDGVAWFRQYFPKSYYAYNAGNLLSVKPSGRKVVEKNLIPNTQSIYNGYVANGYLMQNGTIGSASADYISEYFRVLPNTQYTISQKTTFINSGAVCFYDSNKEFISGTALLLRLSFNITTPSNAYYCRCTQTVDDSRMVQMQIGTTASNIVPYNSSEYLFPQIDLRGLFKLDANNKLYADGDIYNADGKIARKYGIVDLGTLDWTYVSAHSIFYSNVISNMIYTTSGTDRNKNILSAKYPVSSVITIDSNMIDKSMLKDAGRLYIRDTAYSDATTFKTAMDGVYAIYELATPTTESAPIFVNPQRSFSDGTEEWLDTRDVTIPVGNNSTYYQNDTYPAVTEYADGVAKQKVGWDANTILGAHNLLPVVRTSISHNGILFTYNSDGSITASGTITAQGNCIGAFTLYDQFRTDLPSGRYTLTGSLPTSKGYVRVSVREDSDSSGVSYDDVKGDGVTFDYIQGYQMQFAIIIWGAANTVINETYYPMLRFAEDTDTTFKPYVMTNEDITKMKSVQIPPFIYDATDGDWSKFFTALRTHFTSWDNYKYSFCLCESLYSGWQYFQGIVTRRGDRIAGQLLPYGANTTTHTATPYYLFSRDVYTAGQDYIGQETINMTQIYKG